MHECAAARSAELDGARPAARRHVGAAIDGRLRHLVGRCVWFVFLLFAVVVLVASPGDRASILVGGATQLHHADESEWDDGFSVIDAHERSPSLVRIGSPQPTRTLEQTRDDEGSKPR